jgi:hypothetical protein
MWYEATTPDHAALVTKGAGERDQHGRENNDGHAHFFLFLGITVEFRI